MSKKVYLLISLLFLIIKGNTFASTVTQISAGESYSITLKSDSTLWVWGNNYYGQLGDSTTTERLSPIQVGNDTNWVSISAGSSHTMALKSNGTLWSWGSNEYGRLGDGTTTNRYFPVKIGSDTTWASISAGAYHSIALKSDSTLWTWGSNQFGQLGDSTTTDRYSPIQIGSDTTWTSISAGSHYSIALKSDGTVWTWGRNVFGQLGDSTTTDRYYPLQVGNDTDWILISGNGGHTMALKSNGTLWAWGYNIRGQLGDGWTINRETPVQIGDDNDWVSISAESLHTLALKSDNTLWAWGGNNSGQLGDDTKIDKHSQIKIGSDNKWISISGTRAIKSDGSLWAWGSSIGIGKNLEDVYYHPIQIMHIITANADENGNITPSGILTINYNYATTFTITPNTGYHITDVLVDSSSVGAVTSYTFNYVQRDHTIEAKFSVDLPPTEIISTPSILIGPTSGSTQKIFTYTTGGASSNYGHSLEYRFNWGDGTYSNWSALTNATKSWIVANTHVVKTQARCLTHPLVVSSESDGITVNITIPCNIDITSPGSVNRVDGYDLYVLSRAFGTEPGDSDWNLLADLNEDLIVDGNDLIILVANFGENNTGKKDLIKSIPRGSASGLPY